MKRKRERFTVVVTKDGKPATPAYTGTPRATYLAALRSLGFDAEVLLGPPSVIAATCAELDIELKSVRLARGKKKTKPAGSGRGR